MNRFIAWLVSRWNALFGRRAEPYRVVLVEGRFPALLHQRRIYILTEDGDPWEARFVCPCGCKQELDLNLLPDQRPTWTITQDQEGIATIHPSVWRHVGCKSHFFVQNGVVNWCEERVRP